MTPDRVLPPFHISEYDLVKLDRLKPTKGELLIGEGKDDLVSIFLETVYIICVEY